MLMSKLSLWLSLPKLRDFPLENKNNNNGGKKASTKQKTLEKFLFSEYRHFMLEP